MAFTVKDWKDRPAALDPIAGETLEQWEARVAAYVAANPSLVTLINAEAMEDLETRLSAYTDSLFASLLPSPETIAAVIDYWDADDLGAGGSAVSSWTGKKGKALVQATSGNQPVVAASAINGHKAVTFDGSNDWLAYAPGSSFVTTANFECFVVLKRTGGTGSPTAVSLDKVGVGSDWDTNSGAEVIVFLGDTVYAYRNNSTGGAIAWPAARTTYGLLHSYWVGTAHTMEEGATTNSVTIGWSNFDASRLNVGAYAGHDANWFGGNIAGLVVANGLSSGERGSITNFLKARYGL